MIAKYMNSNDAVSPVIGVMLMLVVTIIIAALVSAFAGGLAETQDAPSQLILKATYSQNEQTGGMTITHAGGDTVSLADLKFLTTPSEAMGANYLQFEYEIPKRVLDYTNETGKLNPVMNASTGFYSKAGFIAGDTLTISPENCKDYVEDDDPEFAAATKSAPYYQGWVNRNAQLNWPGPADKSAYFRAYQFGNPANVGNYFYLTAIGPNGNIISKQKVVISP